MRDEQLTDQVAADEQRQDAHRQPTGAERLRREHELLRTRVVEGGDLSTVELLDGGAQRQARRQEPETAVHRRDAVEVVPGIREVDVAAHPGRDLVGSKRQGRHGAEEVEAAHGGKVAHDRGERARVDLSVVHEPATAAAGDERHGEQRGATGQGGGSSMITAG